MTNIREIQKNQFGGLHDFHTERTASMLEALQNEFGEEIVKQVESFDNYGLYRWHLERTLFIIDTLNEKLVPKLWILLLKIKSYKDVNKGRFLQMN